MPYWRLSYFYFFYFAVLGTLVPYWGLYLQSLGYDALAIGQLIAIPMATKIIAPNVWGWLGDHYGHRIQIVRLASFASALIFTSIFWVEGFWPLAISMVFFSFFWNASLPQFEVITLAHLGQKIHQYGRIRLWGSIGFIVGVLLLGILIDHYGVMIVPMIILVFYLGTWIASMSVADIDTHLNEDNGSIFVVLKQPVVIAFLVAAFLMQFGHGAYYAFYSIYMESMGYSKTLIGQLWAIGVIAEVMVFIFMHHFLQRYRASKMLLFSLALASIRWLLIAWFADSLTVLMIAQVFHAVTFGVFHASSIHLVHDYFKGKHQGRGQALYSSISFGAGGALGSLLSGQIWDSLGPIVTYSISSGVSLLAVLLVWRWHGHNRQVL